MFTFCSQTSDKDELDPVSQVFYEKQMFDTTLATIKDNSRWRLL